MKKITSIALAALIASAMAAPAAFAKGSSGDGWAHVKKQEAKYAELRAKKAGTEAPKPKAYERRRVALMP